MERLVGNLVIGDPSRSAERQHVAVNETITPSLCLR